MANEKLNILPVPTFGKLGVNYVQRDLDGYEAKNISVTDNHEGVVRSDISDSTEYGIYAGSGEETFVIQYIKADSSVVLKSVIEAQDNSKVRLVQVFDSKKQIISKLDTQLSENAEFDLVQLYLGGSDTVSEINTVLKGRRTRFGVNIGYVLDEQDKLDINLIADHYGKKSESQIAVNGVLGGNSDKTFKGTIDFKNGSAAAKGSEQENVLLMSETVRNRTVPVILCAEEDVEGSHGATVGKLDEKHIFYMQSRGIPEDKIYELMARSRLMQVIKNTGDPQTENRILHSLGWGDNDE